MEGDGEKNLLDKGDFEMGEALRLAQEKSIGVLDSQFLAKSVSTLNPRAPICVSEDESVENVFKRLTGSNVSSIVVVNESGRLVGIFTERDVVRKALSLNDSNRRRPVREFMTKDPVCQPPDISMAYALNLMSHGGFRHIPLVDKERSPIGVISVRDVMDYIVNSFVEDLLNFETA